MIKPRPDKLRKRIAELYKAGVSTSGLKKRFGISSISLYRILEEFDVPLRKEQK